MGLLFTAIYGLHSVDDRKPLWNKLQNPTAIINSPWLIMGDFDVVNSVHDKINGATFSGYKTRDFVNLLEATDMVELKSCGHFFSWRGKGHRDDKVTSRIDKAFGNSHRWTLYGKAVVEYMNPSLSDHSPLMVDCHIIGSTRSKPFKFFNNMADHPNFLDLVKNKWSEIVHGSRFGKN